MVITPNEKPRPCPKHAYGQYQDSLVCAQCREAAKSWLLWAAFEIKQSYSVVAFSGSSGAAFGYWFADELGLTPVQVFKSSEPRHSASQKLDRYNHAYSKNGWVFLDDFVSTGETYDRVHAVIGSLPVAALLYMPRHYGAMKLGVPALWRPECSE